MLNVDEKYLGNFLEKILYPDPQNLSDKRISKLDNYETENISSNSITKKAAQKGELNILIYEVLLRKSEKPINYNKLIDETKQIFRTLDENLELNIRYREIRPRETNLHNAMKKIVFGGKIYKTEISALHESIKEELSQEDIYEHIKGDNIKCVIGHFNEVKTLDCEDIGSAYAFKEINGNVYSLFLKKYLNTATVCHELAHEIGLPDIYDTKSPDIMSCEISSPIACLIRDMRKNTFFGPESKFLWQKIKEKYK